MDEVNLGASSPRLTASLVECARRVLSEHSQFRGRVDRFHLEERPQTLIVVGVVPSFYLKQLLQTLLRDVDGVERVINRVEVVCAHGISSCSQQTRERCALEHKWLGKMPLCFATFDGLPGKCGDWETPRDRQGAED